MLAALVGLGRSGLAVAPPPPVVGAQHVVGAAVDYSGYPGVTAGTPQADLALLESRMRTVLGVTGLQFAGPHGYSGTSWPATFDTSAVAFAPSVGYSYAFLNVKTGSYTSWAGVRDGNWDAHCTTFVNSVPDNITLIFTWAHEPENDKDSTYGGPIDDGGVWEGTYAPIYSLAFARLANLVAAINRPNVIICWVPMSDTIPANGQLGTLGLKNRDPEKWQPYKNMTATARARTPLSPDFYSNMTSSGGAYQTIASRYQRVIDYNSDAGWGAQKFGVFEHTINNDALASDASVAAAWRDDAKPYFVGLGDALSHYVVFSEATGFASGDHGWVDDTVNGTQPYTAKVTEFGNMVRQLNFGTAPGGTGIAFVDKATAQANNSVPSIVIPSTAAVGDYFLLKYGGTSTITVTDPAGWAAPVVSADSGNIRARWWLHKIASGEPGSTISPTLSGTTRWELEGTVYRGVNATTPLDGTVGVASDNVAQTTHPTGSATSTGTGRMVVTGCWQRSGSIGGVATGTSVWTPPATYTLRSTVASAATLPASSGATADLGNQGAGTFGPLTWTSDVAIGSFVGAVLILKP